MSLVPVSWRARWSRWTVNAALLLMTMDLGGSLYEHLVLDPVWPENVSIIQPHQGGVNRNVFWLPLHAGLTLVLPLALWASWRHRAVRRWVLLATGLYVAMRAWTLVYFVPLALKFESAAGLSDTQVQEAQRWVLLSTFRAPLVFVAVVALWRAARKLTVELPGPRRKTGLAPGGVPEP